MAMPVLPVFSTIDTAHFPAQLDALLQENIRQINHLTENPATAYTWDNLMRPLEILDDKLEKFWFPLSHLHSVKNSPALRECYQACLPKLSAYESAVGHNHDLYQAIKSIDTQHFDEAQHKVVKDALLAFELSGVALSASDKKRFEAIQAKLSELSHQFENNVLDASQAFQLHITDEARLSGIPDHAIHQARMVAEEKQVPGWIFNLETPSYIAVVTYAHDRHLREEMYQAYVTRASDVGPSANTYDNTPVINEMLALRHEKANLLGFANYAELSLASKMAKSTDEVAHFLGDLSQRGISQAKAEFHDLQAFAKKAFGIEDIAPWDIAFVSEKKIEQDYAVSQEELRPYFPLPKVMQGMFSILEKLYGIQFEEIKGMDTWHPEVTCYQVSDETLAIRGYLYVDLFARQHKRSGAWMDVCQTRQLTENVLQLPIASLTCNFAKPVANKPATLSHDEVLTLFHEMGHCLHHVLTQVNHRNVSGIHGVEWDAVELPSQFFENWCWVEESIGLLTSHVDTNQPLPKDLFEKLIAAKNFQSAMGMMRQLEFSWFDLNIHRHYSAENNAFISETLDEVRAQYSVLPRVPYNRFQNSFSHIFAGGYAAGYYSYKWAEVLSSDAFSRFEEEGVFNAQTGRSFLHHILEKGGSRPAADAFIAFRGRAPTADALLHHNDIRN